MRQPVDFDSNNNGYGFLQMTKTGVLHPGKDRNIGSGDFDLGRPVYAPTDCEIVFNEYVKGYGNLMVGYMHKYGTWFRFAHLQNIHSDVKVGAKFKEGFKLAEIGKTGTGSAHLHDEVLIKKLPYWTRYTKWMSKDKVLEYWVNPVEWYDKMIKEEQAQKPQKDPEIVAWFKKMGIRKNWDANPSQIDINDAYCQYKGLYLVATPADRVKYFTLLDINEEMDESINNFK